MPPAMTPEGRFKKAVELCQEAFRRQMEGDLDTAIDFYKRSIEVHPTAEAHTYLGWTYSFQGKLEAGFERLQQRPLERVHSNHPITPFQQSRQTRWAATAASPM